MSWYDVIWLGWIASFLVFEALGLVEEGRIRGMEPLTRLIRDKWMRNPWVWLGFLGFYLWLGVHFFIQGASW